MPTLRESLAYQPVELDFGTSGLRAAVSAMTDLECYINTAGFLTYLSGQKKLAQGGKVFLAGDLRDSTPRILRAVHRAITDGGFITEYHGLIPTPAIAYHAINNNVPCIMVTGSHIPADRNGIKFYNPDGEVLKEEESAIKLAVANVRQWLYSQDGSLTPFNSQGMLTAVELPPEQTGARQAYRDRYLSTFGVQSLYGRKIVFYQHSAVGRDLLADLFRALGAEVITVGRSDTFVPIDSENVTEDDRAYFAKLAEQNHGLFAIVSTDGDSDRPFVIDERGEFHRGDVLGAIVAEWCQADFAAYPVSASDATDTYLTSHNITFEHTKIGSPYVVSAMQKAAANGKRRVVSWEVNGGFLLGSDLAVGGGLLKALPTRDAFFPILVALLSAHNQGTSLSALFARLPRRFTQAGLLNDFPNEISQALLTAFKEDTPDNRAELGYYFNSSQGFDEVTRIDSLDGIRIFFHNGDIAHIRPSGNAPQLRLYAIADSQERADQIVRWGLSDTGALRQMAGNVVRS